MRKRSLSRVESSGAPTESSPADMSGASSVVVVPVSWVAVLTRSLRSSRNQGGSCVSTLVGAEGRTGGALETTRLLLAGVAREAMDARTRSICQRALPRPFLCGAIASKIKWEDNGQYFELKLELCEMTRSHGADSRVPPRLPELLCLKPVASSAQASTGV